MPIDKSWMSIKQRACQEYYTGIEQFLEFAYTHSGDNLGRIKCPCARCCNRVFKKRDEVYLDLLKNGMHKEYIIWYDHGEQLQPIEDDEYVTEEEEWDDMSGLIMDTYGHEVSDEDSGLIMDTYGHEVSDEDEIEEPNDNASVGRGSRASASVGQGSRASASASVGRGSRASASASASASVGQGSRTSASASVGRGSRASASASASTCPLAMLDHTSTCPPVIPQEDVADSISDSSSVPSSSQPSGSKKKRGGRGVGLGVEPTRTGEKLCVEIHDGRIVLEKAIAEAGVLLRENIKGPWATWKAVPMEDREAMWAKYKDKFYFNVDESIARDVFMAHLARIYGDVMRGWRKQAWTTYRTIEERKQHPPEKIDGANWAALVDYWSSPAFLEKSEKSAQNRAKSVILHNAGSRPFAKHHLEHIKETGVAPSAIDMWKKTHTKERKGDKLEHKRTMTSLEDSINFDELMAYKEVVDGNKHGMVTGYGLGVKPFQLFGRSSGGCSSDCRVEKEQYKLHIQQLQSQADSQVAQLAQIQSQIQFQSQIQSQMHLMFSAWRQGGMNAPGLLDAQIHASQGNDSGRGGGDDDDDDDDDDYNEEEEEVEDED